MIARREVILLAIQIEDPLPFPGQQLMIGVGSGVPKYQARLLINFSVTVLKGSSS